MQSNFAALDAATLNFVRACLPTSWDGVFVVITHSGSSFALIPMAVSAVAGLLASSRRHEALLIAASLAAAEVLGWGLKWLVDRDRPALWQPSTSVDVWGSSWPSGHSLNSAALATAAALCAWRMWPRAAPIATAVLMLWAGLVGLSRLVLGVHWPSDVLTGWCLGAAVAATTAHALTRRSSLLIDRTGLNG